MTEELCIFCKIVHRKAPASIIYEDDKVMAFLSIRPLNEGHTLVIPKRHYAFVYEVPDEEVAEMYKLARKIAVALKKSVKADGITIAQQNESAAGQEVFHLHIHIIPRYAGQRLMRFTEAGEAARTRLDEVADLIRQHV